MDKDDEDDDDQSPGVSCKNRNGRGTIDGLPADPIKLVVGGDPAETHL